MLLRVLLLSPYWVMIESSLPDLGKSQKPCHVSSIRTSYPNILNNSWTNLLCAMCDVQVDELWPRGGSSRGWSRGWSHDYQIGGLLTTTLSLKFCSGGSCGKWHMWPAEMDTLLVQMSGTLFYALSIVFGNSLLMGWQFFCPDQLQFMISSLNARYIWFRNFDIWVMYAHIRAFPNVTADFLTIPYDKMKFQSRNPPSTCLPHPLLSN